MNPTTDSARDVRVNNPPSAVGANTARLPLIGLVAACALGATPATSPAPLPASAHDPVVFKQGDTYYLFATGNGLPLQTSKDLVHWTRVGKILDRIPAWAHEKVPEARDEWAPDISLVDGQYRLYYAVSQFGTSHSVMGLLTNTTLDPNDAHYKWVDQGLVLETKKGDDWNAIDPAAFVDADGNAWLAAGSYWSGLKLFALDLKTGKLAADAKPIPIAARPGNTAVEAPFVTHRDGWYYLWVSFDQCCKGAASTYNIRVGRSRSVTGPYVDAAGKPMLEGGGTIVLQSEGDVRGPGHNSVLSDNGTDYLVHHWYDAARNGRRSLGVRKLIWDDSGWPHAGPLMLP